MDFESLKITDVKLIRHNYLEDERGFFARAFCVKEFAELGLDSGIKQANTSFSLEKGTLRGIHYQLAPKAETKIVRCTRGAIFDVVVDLREDSETFLNWCSVELNSENRNMLYVPKGFGHSFITLEDNTEVTYLVTEVYEPEFERTARWNDPAFKIDWPMSPISISEKDKNARDFDRAYHLSL